MIASDLPIPQQNAAARKPVSPKRLAANRANAAKSTGPRSAAGKAAAAFNAIKHGVASRASLIRGEDPVELKELSDAMERDLRPRGALQRELVGRIVCICWKLRRVQRAEEYLGQVAVSRQLSGYHAAVELKLPDDWYDLPLPPED